MPLPNYGMHYILEDKSGMLEGSEFIDVNDRMRLSLRRTVDNPTRTVYMICDCSDYSKPLVALDFGPHNSLGMVSFAPAGYHLPMSQYLVKKSGSKVRAFVGSDGQEYLWTWRTRIGHEWTCTNSNNYIVAYYSLKLPGEPPYSGSSGCSLTVEEAYSYLIVEILASLTIMRHIDVHNL